MLDVDPLLTQRLHGAHDPAAPESTRALDVGAVEERAVERQETTRLQHAANLPQHAGLVPRQVNRVEENDRVG